MSDERTHADLIAFARAARGQVTNRMTLELCDALAALTERTRELDSALAEVGLGDASVAGLIRHHRNNAALAATFDAQAQITAAEERTRQAEAAVSKPTKAWFEATREAEAQLAAAREALTAAQDVDAASRRVFKVLVRRYGAAHSEVTEQQAEVLARAALAAAADTPPTP